MTSYESIMIMLTALSLTMTIIGMIIKLLLVIYKEKDEKK